MKQYLLQAGLRATWRCNGCLSTELAKCNDPHKAEVVTTIEWTEERRPIELKDINKNFRFARWVPGREH